MHFSNLKLFSNQQLTQEDKMNFSEIQLPSNRKFGFFFAAIFIILGFYLFIKGVVNFSYISFVIATLFLSSLSGFSLAKHKFKGSFFIFAAFIAGNFVPAQILMIPVRDLTLKFGLYDTKLSLILFHTAFQIGFCTFFLRGFIKEIPHELVESARIDGASEFVVYSKIILPLIMPALAALAVLEFTFIWNDYFWALVLVQGEEARPITLGIQALRGRWTSAWQLISAASLIVALPPVILFFKLQKHFIAGLTMGAVKE